MRKAVRVAAAAGAWTALAGATWFALARLATAVSLRRGAELQRWRWLHELLPLHLRRFLLVTAGVDESVPALRSVLAPARGLVVDVIAHRRAVVSLLRPETVRVVPARPESLPGRPGSVDVVLAVFAAHELREPREREALFAEVRRLLSADGRMVLIEQHREARTLAVFGPGAWQFYPSEEWRRAAALAGLKVIATRRVSPFVTGWALAAA
ncbi:class I SAM-dependent methyltransferase [Crossiella sp. CA-258035]|uniref:methyltransferase domain-containing protein n=1 Tax=Crossiella sp. CA-258035 TaxID=2981138 RepID=UPI0024BD15F5|nr:class I SAM-dependent methyltransferase [Crossiella sp. CA-258035]WHT21531.1 class I SAM-dependent methyltransferase [Crossiella sp. CA-258035]